MRKIIKSNLVKGRFDVIYEDGIIYDIFFGKSKIPRYEKYHNAEFESGKSDLLTPLGRKALDYWRQKYET